MNNNDDAWRQPLEGQLALLDNEHDTTTEPTTHETGHNTSHPDRRPCPHRGDWPCHDCIGSWSNNTTNGAHQ